MQVGDTLNLEELRAKQLADAQFVADSTELGQLNLAQPGSGIIIIPAVFYFHPDHLGSSTLITDNFGDPYQFFLNLPFGETFAEQRRSGTFNNPYKFNGKELDEETGLYYYGARYYNPRTSVWLSVDPLAEVQPNKTPYHFVSNNPINRIDPTGMLDNPIYDEDGNFLGTDDQGLQGKAIIMNKDNFTQGMSHEDALSHSLGAGGLNEGGLDKLLTHKAGLKDRPDWDGYLTFSEVTKWSNQGNGEPLFVDATKINLNAINVTELKQDKDGYINFFPGSHPNTGLVYGTIKLNLLNENTGAVRLGGKNGLLDVHDFKNPGFKTINDYLSPGTPTDFNIYCAPCNTKIRTAAEVKEYWNQVYKVMGERPKY